METSHRLIQKFHYEHDADFIGDRHALRQIIALPVLRISGLGLPIPPVAGQLPPRSDLCPVGGSGMGLERVPKHQRQFGSGGLVPCGSGIWRVHQRARGG